FGFAIDAKRVVPDDPTANVEAELLRLDLQFGGIFVADREPERAIRLQDSMDGANPVTRPIEIMAVFLGVMIDVVVVANIERRISERQVDRPGGQGVHPRNAVTMMNLAKLVVQMRGLALRHRASCLKVPDLPMRHYSETAAAARWGEKTDVRKARPHNADAC